MRGFLQAERTNAQSTSDGGVGADRQAEPRSSGHAQGSPDGVPVALNESPAAQGLLQLRQALDQAPRAQSQLALQRALNRRGAEPARAGIAETPAPPPFAPLQRKSNRTGLPDRLKAGVESLSGMSLDHVTVHRNSSRPAQLNALAYAQGSDIHVAPGQERHLPHEAWHVVQQAQGRVKPTLQLKGLAINDDDGLEHEADVMGARALARAARINIAAAPSGSHAPTGHPGSESRRSRVVARTHPTGSNGAPVQAVWSWDEISAAAAVLGIGAAAAYKMARAYGYDPVGAALRWLRGQPEADDPEAAVREHLTREPDVEAGEGNLRSRVEEWLDTKTEIGEAKLEQLANSGKNNLGIFRVRNKPYIVKAVRESAGAQFERLMKLDEKLAKQEADPDMPHLGKIVQWEKLEGVAALGLFEEAKGQSLENLHKAWVGGKIPEHEITQIYSDVGSGMGAFNLAGVQGHGSKKKKLTLPARMHGDANPSNLFVDPNGKTTLIDNEGVNLDATLSAFSYELGSLLMNFERKSFTAAGEARKEALESGSSSADLTGAERRTKAEMGMFLAFARGYVGKADKTIKDIVVGELEARRDTYKKLYLDAAGIDEKTAERLIPEFFSPVG